MGAIKLLLPSDFKASKAKLVPHLFQKSRSSWRCCSHWTTDWPAGCRFGQAEAMTELDPSGRFLNCQDRKSVV